MSIPLPDTILARKSYKMVSGDPNEVNRQLALSPGWKPILMTATNTTVGAGPLGGGQQQVLVYIVLEQQIGS